MVQRPKGTPEPAGRQPLRHVSEAELLRYLEGDLSGNELAVVRTHLNQCRACLHLLTGVKRETLQLEDTAAITAALEGVELDRGAQLQRLVQEGYVQPAVHRPAEERNAMVLLVWLQLWRRQRSAVRRGIACAGLAAAAALVAFGIAIPQYHHWRAQRLVTESRALLAPNLVLTERAAFRPSGFLYSPFTRQRSDSTDTPAERAAVRRRLQEALEHDPHSAAAHELFTAYYLTREPNLDSARVHASQALSLAANAASALNSLAVIAWREGDTTAARAYLLSALQAGPDAAEVLYNLALLYQATGDSARARETWKRYLELDSNSEWAAFATEQLARLQSKSNN